MGGGSSCIEMSIWLSRVQRTHVREERHLKIHFASKLFFVCEGMPFLNPGLVLLEAQASNAPSCSPFVSTVVRSTNVSPMSSGSRASSAQHANFMTRFDRDDLGVLSGADLESTPSFGGGDGARASSAVRASSSSMSSNTGKRISSSHSGCWPPRLMVFVRPLRPSNSTEQYGSCFPMCLLFGRWFCRAILSYAANRRSACATYCLVDDNNECSDFSRIVGHDYRKQIQGRRIQE